MTVEKDVISVDVMAAPYHEQADETLMQSYASGDADAFNALLRRYKTQMYTFFLRRTGSAVLAEDMFQELFVRVIRHADSYVKRAKFSTWLYTIARNLCIDHYRAATHRNHASLDASVKKRSASDSGVHRIDTIAGDHLPAEGLMDDQRFLQDLVDKLGELPDEQREVFVLRMINQLAFADIARIVAASEGTVKSRLRYALISLRSGLGQYRQEAK